MLQEAAFAWDTNQNMMDTMSSSVTRSSFGQDISNEHFLNDIDFQEYKVGVVISL